MKISELAIPGVFKATSKIESDQRGTFREWFRDSVFFNVSNTSFVPTQANLSISSKYTLRGIHYSLAKEGQSKWVTCVTGSLLDLVIDLRVGSPTFGNHLFVTLESNSGDSIYIPNGFGHAFLALQDQTCITYLLSSEYEPGLEHEISPLDSSLKINWPDVEFVMSNKDLNAPSLENQRALKLLPQFRD
jgi:dTDP-4-dehydrorhamnose 3,5-epimerase